MLCFDEKAKRPQNTATNLDEVSGVELEETGQLRVRGVLNRGQQVQQCGQHRRMHYHRLGRCRTQVQSTHRTFVAWRNVQHLILCEGC